MLSAVREPAMASDPLSPRDGPDRETRISVAAEMDGVLSAVHDALVAAGYPERARFEVRLALEEALVNALKHGNRGDWRKHVSVQWEVSAHHVLLAVEDQGHGFDPAGVPDPLAPENLCKLSGRGLLLMRHFLSWVRYNGRGNRVTLCKLRPN
jgi:serine/threonine-protein kinase RsbW